MSPSSDNHSAGVAHALVLLVEDDRDGREMYAEFLQYSGFRVVQAHNGNQAFSKALDESPDVIVTDLGLPGIDGFELCRKLRHEPRTSHIPLIAVTGRFYRNDDFERARREGCEIVLRKPCSPDALVAEVSRILQLHRFRPNGTPP